MFKFYLIPVKINHLVCCDIAELSVEQCRERYNHFKNSKFPPEFTLESFVCDSTVERQREHYEDPSLHFNLVSCQFAFHYCFESLPQAEVMLRNAAECLIAGGFFIGTIPDAYEIMRRRKLSDSNEFGNEIYKIEFEYPDEPPLFGAKYNFFLDGVVNCPEFLVHFPTFIKLARKFGLKLVEKTRFDDFFLNQTKTNQKSQFLLERMDALETYPPRQNAKCPAKGDGNYCDTKERFDASKTPLHQVGTLSKCEWEAISKYLAFGAFLIMMLADYCRLFRPLHGVCVRENQNKMDRRRQTLLRL